MYYQEHSLGSHFPDIDTTLECPYWDHHKNRLSQYAINATIKVTIDVCSYLDRDSLLKCFNMQVSSAEYKNVCSWYFFYL